VEPFIAHAAAWAAGHLSLRFLVRRMSWPNRFSASVSASLGRVHIRAYLSSASLIGAVFSADKHPARSSLDHVVAYGGSWRIGSSSVSRLPLPSSRGAAYSACHQGPSAVLRQSYITPFG